MEEYIELVSRQNKIAEASRYRRHAGRCRDRRRVLTLQWASLAAAISMAITIFYLLSLTSVI